MGFTAGIVYAALAYILLMAATMVLWVIGMNNIDKRKRKD